MPLVFTLSTVPRKLKEPYQNGLQQHGGQQLGSAAQHGSSVQGLQTHDAGSKETGGASWHEGSAQQESAWATKIVLEAQSRNAALANLKKECIDPSLLHDSQDKRQKPFRHLLRVSAIGAGDLTAALASGKIRIIARKLIAVS